MESKNTIKRVQIVHSLFEFWVAIVRPEENTASVETIIYNVILIRFNFVQNISIRDKKSINEKVKTKAVEEKSTHMRPPR